MGLLDFLYQRPGLLGREANGLPSTVDFTQKPRSGMLQTAADLMAYGPFIGSVRNMRSQQEEDRAAQQQQRAMQQQLMQLQLAQAQKASVAPDQIAASMRTAGMPRLQATSPDASGLSELTPQRPSDFQQMLGASQSLLRQGNIPGSDMLLEQAKARMPAPVKPPTSREIVRGNQTVTQEFDPARMVWNDVSSGARFAPTQPAKNDVGPLETIVDPVTGQPRLVRREDAVGNQPYRAPNIAPKDINTARQKITMLNVARQQLNAAKTAFENIKGGMTAGGGGQGMIPSVGGKQFDAAIDTLRNTFSGLTRVPGVGSMSDYETRLAQAGMPARTDYEAVTEQKLRALDDLVAALESGYGSLLEQVPGGAPGARQPVGATGGWSIVKEK